MKPDIHPEYVLTHVTCSCGNEFTTRSTKAELHVEICSAFVERVVNSLPHEQVTCVSTYSGWMSGFMTGPG